MHVRHDEPQVGPVVVPQGDIDRRVGELAEEIAAAYRGRELTILAVLTGALIFLADLIRRMPVMMRVDLVSVTSYPQAATTSRGPRMSRPWSVDLSARHVLIVDDILDTGQTLEMLKADVAAAGAADVATCVLLRKRGQAATERLRPDFVGFDVPDEFLVGYGLDHDSLYRNLPDVRVLRHNHGEPCP